LVLDLHQPIGDVLNLTPARLHMLLDAIEEGEDG
jgi:hypothetical protein